MREGDRLQFTALDLQGGFFQFAAEFLGIDAVMAVFRHGRAPVLQFMKCSMADAGSHMERIPAQPCARGCQVTFGASDGRPMKYTRDAGEPWMVFRVSAPLDGRGPIGVPVDRSRNDAASVARQRSALLSGNGFSGPAADRGSAGTNPPLCRRVLASDGVLARAGPVGGGRPMWAVNNQTPYAANRAWGRDKDGVHQWIVAVKATYDIGDDGSVALAEKQLDCLLLPEHHGEDGVSSLRYDADVVGPKPTTDIVLNGTAYAPQGRPTTSFLVSLRVGTVRKVLKVVGNRSWKQGVLGRTPSATEPVAQVPLVYERAYGGFDQTEPDPEKQRIDARNPVGCGLVTRVGHPLPNFEYPVGSLEKAGPAGFGVIASHWSPRLELQGTYDDAWKTGRFPLLPTDWDPRSLLCSPADQRPQAHLRGGEIVDLENLTPGGRLSFGLPKVYLRFRTRIDGQFEEHRGHLSTVIIEPDHRRVCLVWQSSLAVRHNGDYLDETVVTEKKRLR